MEFVVLINCRAEAGNFPERIFHQGCFHGSFVKFCKTDIQQNVCEQLLLIYAI